MSRWEKHLKYNESQFAKLLHEVVTDVYTDAGKFFDTTFWKGFTEELNKRVESVNVVAGIFVPFTTSEIVDHGRVIRDKWSKYKNCDQPYSGEMKIYLEKIFPQTSLVRFPSNLNSSGSCSRITKSGSSSRSRGYRAKTVDACESSLGGFMTYTEYGSKAHAFLMQMYNGKTSELQISLLVLDRDLALLRAFTAIEDEVERVAYAKELTNRSL